MSRAGNWSRKLPAKTSSTSWHSAGETLSQQRREEGCCQRPQHTAQAGEAGELTEGEGSYFSFPDQGKFGPFTPGGFGPFDVRGGLRGGGAAPCRSQPARHQAPAGRDHRCFQAMIKSHRHQDQSGKKYQPARRHRQAA